MVSDTDFVALYQELELGPDCTLEQFKRAYRRRVARLHPDLAGQPGDIARLQRLNRLYEAALAFQRQHGRLPGAPVPPVHGAGARTPAAGRSAAVGGPAAGPAGQARAPRGTSVPGVAGPASRLRYAIPIAVVVAAAALLWLRLEDDPRRPTETAAGAARTVPTAADGEVVTATGWIELGMEARRVLAIQGPPLNAYERRWDYGPSWIGFQCGKVVDWYSSPLRPLRVGSESPVGDPGWARDRACGRHPIHGEP